VLLVLACLSIVVVIGIKMYLVDQRYPNMPLIIPGGDPSLFFPKLACQLLVFLSTTASGLFWFHLVMAMYWLVIFKAQVAPQLLLPSALGGDEYEPHDVMLLLVFCLAVLTVTVDLLKRLRTFIFLVDWESGAPLAVSGTSYGGGASTSGMVQHHHHGFHSQQSTLAGQSFMGSGQMMGSSLLHSGSQGGEDTAASPDAGVSAWRTLFVCNQLNERLASTRTKPHITWVVMIALLEGLSWKNAARWYPRYTGDESLLSVQFNPFIQFALASSLWLVALFLQLLVRRVSSIRFGNECCDFVDVCSVANVSVLFMDEPFHGFYIHGKAPSSRGDWCHTELAKVLHDEHKGIGLSRGLTPDGCQCFEFFLPPDLAIQMPNTTTPVHFRQFLNKVFGDVNTLLAVMASRLPERPTIFEVAQMSTHRCLIQSLIDAKIHAVMRGASEVVRGQESVNWFRGFLPQGGINALRQPVFYKDMAGLKWCTCLAYGSALEVAGIDVPTGFEWHLGMLELMLFQLVWRFNGSVFLAAAAAFLLNQAVLSLYGYFGRLRLAYTSVIDEMFMLGRAPPTQSCIYLIIALALLIHAVS